MHRCISMRSIDSSVLPLPYTSHNILTLMQYPRPIIAARMRSDQGGGQKDDFVPNMSVRSPSGEEAGKPIIGLKVVCSCINFGS